MVAHACSELYKYTSSLTVECRMTNHSVLIVNHHHGMCSRQWTARDVWSWEYHVAQYVVLHHFSMNIIIVLTSKYAGSWPETNDKFQFWSCLSYSVSIIFRWIFKSKSRMQECLLYCIWCHLCHVFMIAAIFFHPHLVMTCTIVRSELAVLAPCTIGGGWSHMQVDYLLP